MAWTHGWHMAYWNFGLRAMLVATVVLTLGCGGSDSGADLTAQQFRPVQDPASESSAKAAKSGELELSPATNATANPAAPRSTPVTPPPTPPASLDKPVGEASTPANAAEANIPPEYQAKLKQLRDLENVKPRGTTREQQIQFIVNALNTRLTLAEALAMDPAAPEVVHEEALLARVSCYAMLVDADQPDAREKFALAAKDLSEVKNPNLAVMGKAQLFSLKMMEIFALQPRDGKEVVASISNLLQETGQAEIGFEATVRVVQLLERQQFMSDAVAAMKIIGDHFAASPNPQLALQSRGLQLSALMLALQSAEGEAADAVGEQLVGKLQEIVKLSKGDDGVLELALNVARILEGHGNGSRSLPVYELMESTYGQHENEKLAAETRNSVKNAKLRIGLVGQPFEVTGVLREGEKFDWSPYRDKVVLIDFWATWCGPCLAEMSNIRRNYNQYHDRGFEVIGVNLDESAEDLAAFFAKQELPWTTVLSPDPKRVGFHTPLAEQCGVDAIPFVILVGRDGKVAGIHVRGERLQTQLAQLLGDDTKPNETKPEAVLETPKKPS